MSSFGENFMRKREVLPIIRNLCFFLANFLPRKKDTPVTV
jgi:hypothetical protein